ncbi:EF-hand domain [Dillenia turbinata]|uniref:EF-hand domain n=1 Tax=Dillenia turbinata TaxID=194707 RepID=A0AAN8UJY5_9MAGN
MAYYYGGSEELKQDIKKRFNELDKDRDGILSLQELRNAYNCSNEVFMIFERDNNGSLNFQEFITFYYATKNRWHWCDECKVTVTTFFTCVHCFGGSSPINLCCKCYSARQSTLARDPMESLRKIATTYYKKGSEHVKQLIIDFFYSMDINRDRQISLHEFLYCMTQEGYSEMSNPNFIALFDKDGNKTLDFYEFLMLYYVMRSGRRFCCGCGCFLDGMYLTCVPCFETNAHSFCVCFKCYHDNTYIHEHCNFLDNFALLEMKRQKALKVKMPPESAPQYGQFGLVLVAPLCEILPSFVLCYNGEYSVTSSSSSFLLGWL